MLESAVLHCHPELDPGSFFSRSRRGGRDDMLESTVLHCHPGLVPGSHPSCHPELDPGSPSGFDPGSKAGMTAIKGGRDLLRDLIPAPRIKSGAGLGRDGKMRRPGGLFNGDNEV